MKRKWILPVIFMALTVVVTAQKITVTSINPVEFSSSGGYFYPEFSPAGDYLLLTTENYTGLKMYNFSDQSLKELNQDAGAGYNPQISADGNTILYRKSTFNDNKRMNSLQSYTRISGASLQMIAPTREQITPQFSQNKPTYIQGKSLVRPNVITSELKPVVTIENQKMVLYTVSGRRELSPNGAEASYIWPAVSPDAKNIVYTVAGKGTFVCQIDGTNVKSLGRMNAPVWINNIWVVGMNDKDDGHNVIESSLVAATIDGKVTQVLPVPAGVLPMYPAVSKDATRIAFNTPKGVLYLMQININQ